MQLNVEQKKLIQGKTMGQSLIKGVAGSGKTTVAVHRIQYLLDNYCYSKDDKVLMVTFNKSLVSYIRYIYEYMSEEKEYKQQSLFESNHTDKLTIMNIDKMIYAYYMKYCTVHHKNFQIIDDMKELQYYQKAICELKNLFPDVRLLEQKYARFLQKEIHWMKACGYTELEVYQQVDRVGRMSTKNIDGPQKIMKNSRSRQAIYEVMMSVHRRMQDVNCITFLDVAAYAQMYIEEYGAEEYTHILIDESQDLSRIQLKFLLSVYKRKEYSSIMFVADTAQSIYDTAWLVKGRSFTSIGLDMTGKSNSLAKNYRTTTQIAQAAFSLIEEDDNIVQDDNYVKPFLIDRQGSYPIIHGAENFNSELSYLAEVIKKNHEKYEYRDIVIVARTKKILDEEEKYLKSVGIPCCVPKNMKDIDFDKDEVKMITMHSIKGLEFKVVLLTALCENIIPNPYVDENDDKEIMESMERRLLYVGMTRAKEKVYLSFHEKPSKFLSEIESRYLKLDEDKRFSAFYKISLEHYCYQNKIAERYSKEEEVRQWLITQLRTYYLYPFELIDLEYEVNTFSKKGYVDVVVNRYENGRKVPFIFVECKAFGNGIEQAVGQLKSYMSVEKRVQYGIATDGNDVVVLDQQLAVIPELPMFDDTMLGNVIEEYSYVDSKTNRQYSFVIDEDKPNELVISEAGQESVIEGGALTRMPLYEKIAAGQPLQINEYIQDAVVLPSEWLRYNGDNIAVTVQGSSMINCGINNGDKVIVHIQGSADIGDIIAADINDTATLKRFAKAGSTVILSPENSEYEPILVDEKDLRIIGVAIGWIKKRKI